MMRKWQVGKFYMKGFVELLNGRSNKPLEIFELSEIDYEKETVTLVDVESKESITIDQDDRYGHYPLLDKNRINGVESTYDTLMNQVTVLRDAMRQMNKIGLRDDR